MLTGKCNLWFIMSFMDLRWSLILLFTYLKHRPSINNSGAGYIAIDTKVAEAFPHRRSPAFTDRFL